MELPLRAGDEVQVLSKTDSQGNPSEWWKGSPKQNLPNQPPRVGFFPANFVELIGPQNPSLPL